MPTNKPEVVLPELPELPEPRLRPYTTLDTVYFNAGQMKSYARAYGQACYDAALKAPPVQVETVKYDRDLIACMLQDFRSGRLDTWKRESVDEQIKLLREADNHESRARTVCLGPQPPAASVEDVKAQVAELLAGAKRLGLMVDTAVPLSTLEAIAAALQARPVDVAQSKPQQPAEAVAVDLERFRAPVKSWIEMNQKIDHLSDVAAWAVTEGKHLLAIIDGAPPTIDIGKLRGWWSGGGALSSLAKLSDIAPPKSM